MALINFARSEIEVKIVFYGPALSGKTTNVEILHRMMPDGQRGELHSLRTQEDRTLFFDYFPLRLGEIAGFTARFKVFTVPGQAVYKETRRVLLQGADAVVFVADSSPERAQANMDALVDLEANLTTHGLDLHSIPLVIQLNKRDAPGALPVEQMSGDLNPFGVPVIEAVAAEGRGVLDTLRQVTEIAAQRIRENLSGQATAVQLTAIDRHAPEDEKAVVREQLEHIRRVRPKEEAAFRAMSRAGQVHAGDVDAVLSELVVRSEDVTPPEPIPPQDGPFDELPVPRGDVPRLPRPVMGLLGSERTPARGAPRLPVESTPPRGAPPVDEPTPARGVEVLLDPAVIEAWLGLPGVRVDRVVRAEVLAGELVLELVLDHAGELRRHPVRIQAGARQVERVVEPVVPPVAPVAPVEPVAPVVPAAAPTWSSSSARWVAFGTAAVVAAVAGTALGVGLGWLAFAG